MPQVTCKVIVEYTEKAVKRQKERILSITKSASAQHSIDKCAGSASASYGSSAGVEGIGSASMNASVAASWDLVKDRESSESCEKQNEREHEVEYADNTTQVYRTVTTVFTIDGHTAQFVEAVLMAMAASYIKENYPEGTSITLNFKDSDAAGLGLGNLQVNHLVHLADIGDVETRGNFAGTRGQSRRLEGFQLTLVDANGQKPNGVSLEYMAHLADVGNTAWVGEGSFCGTRGLSRRLEGFAVRLKGPNAKFYKVRYMAHLQGIGDTGFFENEQFCGTCGQSRAVEGLYVTVEPV